MTTKKKTLPSWSTREFSAANLRGIRSELKDIKNWSDGYNAGRSLGVNSVPGSGLLGGPARSLALTNKLLEAYRD